jgi:hypothetical protein
MRASPISHLIDVHLTGVHLTVHISHGRSDFSANGQVDTNCPSGPPYISNSTRRTKKIVGIVEFDGGLDYARHRKMR